jgi:transcriptional regulator with XRE-family HTH domain
VKRARIRPTEIATCLKFYRHAEDLTQKQVADRMTDTSPSTLSRIERDEENPKLSTLQDIANVLDIEIVILPNGTDCASPDAKEGDTDSSQQGGQD